MYQGDNFMKIEYYLNYSKVTKNKLVSLLGAKRVDAMVYETRMGYISSLDVHFTYEKGFSTKCGLVSIRLIIKELR